jgi:type I restriction enzyme R subunit
MTGSEEPTADQIATAEEAMKTDVMRLLSPALRNVLKDIHSRDEIVVDNVSLDRVLFAGYDSTDNAQAAVRTFQEFIKQHRDEITALRILYSIPYKNQQLEWAHITELAERLKQPPLSLTPERLWAAYAKVEPEKVRMGATKRLLTDLVALVRHALQPESELIPYPDQVQERYQRWLEGKQQAGKRFTNGQRAWLDAIAGQIGVNLDIKPRDFNDLFYDQGGWSAAVTAFGDAASLRAVLDELNTSLAA